MILLQIKDFIYLLNYVHIGPFYSLSFTALSNLTLNRLETTKTHMVFQRMYFPGRVKPWIL